MRRRFWTLAVAAIATATLTAGVAAAGSGATRSYEVTITNLTAGQPLTPPVVAIHNPSTGFFSVGETASYAISQVAENGNLAPLVDAVNADKAVSAVFVGGAPLLPAGTPGGTMFADTVTFSIDAAAGAKFLSAASMLVCTNDGFAGFDTLRLPKKVGDVITASGGAYDAGSEWNTEDFADIVPPCQPLIGVSSGDTGTGTSNPALAEGGVVHGHGGVAGGNDLVPSVHGWTDPVISISVERTN